MLTGTSTGKGSNNVLTSIERGHTDPQTLPLRSGGALETRWDSLLSHPDSCPTDGVHLNRTGALFRSSDCQRSRRPGFFHIGRIHHANMTGEHSLLRDIVKNAIARFPEGRSGSWVGGRGPYTAFGAESHANDAATHLYYGASGS